MTSQVVAILGDSGVTALTAKEMRAHIQRIQEVMKAVMKEGVHYGKIPGAGDKMSLFKAGAEVLCATFHIAPTYKIEDLSDHDSIRYRVICVGTHQGSGTVLGEGLGEASSNEEKYKWRNAVCDEEFDETFEDRRRSKWQRSKGGGEPYRRNMIRTEPADIANTVLKMAGKRAQVAMTINVTACSDIFTQDLEDLPEGMLGGEEGGGQRARGSARSQARGKSGTSAPQPRQGAGNAQPQGPQRTQSQPQQASMIPPQDAGPKISADQAKIIDLKLSDFGVNPPMLYRQFGIQQVADLPASRYEEALAWIKATNGD